MQLSSKDLEFLRNEYNKIKDEAIKYSNKDIETKKEFILRLKAKAIELFNAEGRDIHELASYIRNDLEQYQFSIAQSYFFELFTDDEKRNYSEKFGSEHSHSFELEGNIEKCKCGIIKFNGLLYEIREEKQVEPLVTSATTSKEKPDPFTNETTEYYQRIKENCNFLASIADDLVSKYYENREIADIMEMFNVDLQEQKDLEAELLFISKLTDMRQKVGKFEKIKALLLEKCMYNIAKVAKLVDITPKHLSANVIGKERDAIIDKLAWFKSIEIKCSCGKVNRKEIAHWFNHQYERSELDLPLEEGIFN